MKKMTSIIMVMIMVVIGNQMVVNAADNAETAYEICKSSTTWKEFVESFADFQCERGDFLGMCLKELPEKISKASTFHGVCDYGAIPDEELAEFTAAMAHAIMLYNMSGNSNLRFSVKMEDSDSQYGKVDIQTVDNPLTHIGNVVKCYNIPYYENADNYFGDKDACYYNKQVICYTCGVAYWNSNKTLARMEYIPFDKVAELRDEQKPKIDREFKGKILVLLCTTDTVLGWTSIDGLYQYEDVTGNMEFYNPDFISYYK